MRNLILDPLGCQGVHSAPTPTRAALLLRHERRYHSTMWWAKHRPWLHNLKFAESADQISLRIKTDIMGDLERRVAELKHDIEHEL